MMTQANHLEIGKTLFSGGRYEAARPFFETALVADPLSAEAHYYIARIHFVMRSVERSLEHHLEALRLGMDPEHGGHERWMCWMLLGRFEDAWEESDRTRARRGKIRDPHESFTDNHSLWDGTPPEDKDVVVRCYHGLGDTIQFLRYVPLLKKICRTVSVEVQPELLPLFQKMEGSDLLISWEDGIARPPFDVELECMELPYIFRSTIFTLPNKVPYIRFTPAGSPKGRGLLSRYGGLKVGLVWASGPWNGARSIPPFLLDPLLSVPGVRVFSFQESPEAGEAAYFASRGVIDTRRHFVGMIATCSAMMEMDLVLSVDTMAAHLAGALGKRVWLLLLYDADWRWMIARNDSPWYPTMRLFRQPQPGDWETAIEEVRRELTLLAKVGSME
jgi:tetratricopeptide (TPR) repeat protein